MRFEAPGLFSGVAFKAPRKLTLRASYEAFMAIHPAMFGQVLVMRLFNDHNILTQICGNNFTVLKVAPPLIVTRDTNRQVRRSHQIGRGTGEYAFRVLERSARLSAQGGEHLTMVSDVCIAGGGPAGLAAALALRQQGFEVTVVDCAVPPIDKACGEGLMPDSLAALRRLGVELDVSCRIPFQGHSFQRWFLYGHWRFSKRQRLGCAPFSAA